MFAWIFGGICAVAVIGYVAHKWPTWFGAAVDAGAAEVNKIGDQIKDATKK